MGTNRTRTLLLLRHAKSSWDDPASDDFDRPLNARGRRAAQLMAAHLALAAQPDLIVCSTARRTRETLEPILAAFGHDHAVRFERVLYLAGVEALLEIVRGLPEAACSVLLVGHNPGLHDLADMLAGAGDAALRRRLADKLPTGALATIAIAGPWPKAAAGAGRLVSYATPRDLA